MASRERSKPDPFMIDEETMPLTDEEMKRLRPTQEVFAELGIIPHQTDDLITLELTLDRKTVEHFSADGEPLESRIIAALHKLVEEAEV